MSDNHVGLEAVPDDEDMVEWLEKRLENANSEKEELVKQLIDVMQYGKEEDEPYLFSYARLLNFLATLEQPQLVRILSAAVWEIAEADIS